MTGHRITEAYIAYRGKITQSRIWFRISKDEKKVPISSRVMLVQNYVILLQMPVDRPFCMPLAAVTHQKLQI